MAKEFELEIDDVKMEMIVSGRTRKSKHVQWKHVPIFVICHVQARDTSGRTIVNWKEDESVKVALVTNKSVRQTAGLMSGSLELVGVIRMRRTRDFVPYGNRLLSPRKWKRKIAFRPKDANDLKLRRGRNGHLVPNRVVQVHKVEIDNAPMILDKQIKRL